MGLAALLPLLAFAGFALLAALGSFRAVDEVRLRGTARALAVAVDAHLASHVAALDALTSTRLLDDSLDVAALEERARSLDERLDGAVFLLGPGPEHATLASTRRWAGAALPGTIPEDARTALAVPLRQVFGSGEPSISDLFEGPVVRRPVLTVMVPVEREGQPRRGLGLSFEPRALRELLARQDLPDGTFAAVADGHLRILAHSFDPEGRLVGARAPEWVGGAIEGRQRTLIVGPGWSGQDNVYAVERLTLAPGWTVTVAEPLASQQASAWAAVRWLLAGGAALGLGLVVVVWADRRDALQDARREADALRAGRADVRRLHAALPAVVFLREVAPDGTSRLLYRGGDLQAVMGWPPEELATRQNFEDLVHPEDTTLARAMPRLLHEGQVSYEWRMRQPSGGWRVLHTLGRVLARRPDGSAEIVGYTVDVTARREAEARAMAAARLASVGEMAAGLAHELRQPLQSISLAAEVAQIAVDLKDSPEVDRRLQQILEHTHRTADLIERLRRFARGPHERAMSDAVPLRAAVSGALDLTRSALGDASISVEVALGDPAPVVLGEAVLLEQVLSNLLLNARDALALRPAGAPRQIRIAAEPGVGGTVRLSIADTGGGIAPEVMARLFEPFVTTKGPDRGTGLGLSICHGLVTGMGGSIEARNDAEGAVFTITLNAA